MINPNYMSKYSRILFLYAILFLGLSWSCTKKEQPDPIDPPPVDTTNVNKPINFDLLKDTYYELASAQNVYQWGIYNTHDPAVLYHDGFYYSYSTDVAFGATVQPGLQIRRSKNLIEWQFVGWVFDGLPKQGADFIRSNGGEPFKALWAPYVVKVGTEFRLYYSLSSAKPRLSVIGMATAKTPIGPWTEKGLTVTSLDDRNRQTNAIDPSVLIDPSGKHWMYYGSAWDGIYLLPLNPETGQAASSGDKGVRVANRGFTSGRYNGNIEGPEIIYNEQLGKYYLFISYDWLESKYNVRVGRSNSPEGPFLDYQGRDLNQDIDHGPMILAPYQFKGHSGWQGTAHCGVFKDDKGQYFMAHQGRPGENRFFMNLHVRKIHWTEDGWPVVSPQRYAGVAAKSINKADLVGNWEFIRLGYKVVPGYAEEQTSPDFQVAQPYTLNIDGSFNNNAANRWDFNAPWLSLTWADGKTAKVWVEYGRDWENKVAETLLWSGLDQEGVALWGKKIK